MSDSPTIPEGDLGFDAISYAREIVSTPSHHDADEFSACARETLSAMLAAWDRLRERHDTLFRNHAFLMATKIPPTVISMPAPSADAATEAVREAFAALLSEPGDLDYPVEDVYSDGPDVDGNGDAPFWSEGGLYGRVGKEAARTLLARHRRAMEALAALSAPAPAPSAKETR